eukprot:scaffold649860_cov39-Prasinocladus_malaysianus.AAC.1
MLSDGLSLEAACHGRRPIVTTLPAAGSPPALLFSHQQHPTHMCNYTQLANGLQFMIHCTLVIAWK